MYKLVPFYEEKNQFELQGAIQYQNQILQMTFQWEPQNVGIDMALQPHQNVGKRSHELWKQTCFEAFVKLEGSNQYFEINLSTLGHWNIYQFDECRNPQPPKEWPLANLLSFQFKPGNLTASIKFPLESNQKLSVGLTAIIDYIDGRKNYFSLKHAEAQPNFHDFKTFLIERYS